MKQPFSFFAAKKEEKEWHRLFCVPVFDTQGRLLAVIEYVRNITTNLYQWSGKIPEWTGSWALQKHLSLCVRLISGNLILNLMMRLQIKR